MASMILICRLDKDKQEFRLSSLHKLRLLEAFLYMPSILSQGTVALDDFFSSSRR